MISLNLLPLERKEIFLWRARTKNIIFWGFKILFFLIILCAPFLIFRIYLMEKLYILNEKNSAYEQTKETKQIEELGKSSQSINILLENVNKISENKIYWTGVLGEISKNIPSGIQIFNMEITPSAVDLKIFSPSEGKFSISGLAKTREDVLAMEKNLKSSSSFKNIESPLGNLTKRNDVDFRFTGIFILENFKAKEIIKK